MSVDDAVQVLDTALREDFSLSDEMDRALRAVLGELRARPAATAAVVVDAAHPSAASLRRVADERERQLRGEGFTLLRDDGYGAGELAKAAGAYALYSTKPDGERHHVPLVWPWHPSWWKAGTPERMLVKAGALIVAELDRRARAGGG